MGAFNELTEMLHACTSSEELCRVITVFANLLFMEECGAIYLFKGSIKLLAMALAQQVALGLSNLRLRDMLNEDSVRDEDIACRYGGDEFLARSEWPCILTTRITPTSFNWRPTGRSIGPRR